MKFKVGDILKSKDKSEDRSAKITKIVPTTQATSAPFAIFIFSGLPAAVNQRMPAMIQPITTIDPPIAISVVLRVPNRPVKV